ncbi:MAG: HNH endonuclease, partial [Candidatus Dormibacteraeota bacterium]|nr:HNH endonuclease [Candidatus Dormibacteraeota bacterium]
MADRVAVGELVGELEQTIEALVDGQVGFAHLTVMARTSNAVGPSFNEKALLDQARQNSPGKFHHICRHYRHSVDPKGFAAEEVELVENRRLSLSTWEDGSLLFSGILDPVGGAALRTALEPLARRSGAHDDRNRERRLADALVDLSMHALDTGLIPQQASQRTHLQVTTSLETLRGLPGAAAAEMEFSLPISAKTVERLACDCSITRILLGSDSTVIDVGRAKRVISGPQRKALNARDKGCVWPGCDRPASWTSGHHLEHWIRGGSGDLPNLVL